MIRCMWWLMGLAVLLATPLAQAGTVTYVYTDPQGTPLAEADASGNITARFEYTPYGVSVPSMGVAPNGVGYTGHVNDPESGFVYMQARYYDPAVGRFLSVDPVGPEAGNEFGFNRYAYANDNPYKYIDPDGMNPKDQWFGFNDRKFQDWVHSEKQTLGRGGSTKLHEGRIGGSSPRMGEPRKACG